jgi:hypothetical protein
LYKAEPVLERYLILQAIKTFVFLFFLRKNLRGFVAKNDPAE